MLLEQLEQRQKLEPSVWPQLYALDSKGKVKTWQIIIHQIFAFR